MRSGMFTFRERNGGSSGGTLAPAEEARAELQGPVGPVPEPLRGLYECYCEVEAMALLSLMPREGLREFYGRAIEWGAGSAAPDRSDPLALARAFARHLLALPDYDSWVVSYLADRMSYLNHLGVSDIPRTDEPVTISVRGFGDGWYASLCLNDSTSGWQGFIQFHRSEGVRTWQTATVFREDDPEVIRARFSGFDDHTLQAFLRSVLD